MFFSEKAINDSFSHASRLKWEKEKSMMDKLDYTQFKLFLRILRMTYNFYEVGQTTVLSYNPIYNQLGIQLHRLWWCTRDHPGHILWRCHKGGPREMDRSTRRLGGGVWQHWHDKQEGGWKCPVQGKLDTNGQSNNKTTYLISLLLLNWLYLLH